MHATPTALRGFRVAVTADRRAREQADALGRRGASVVLAPVLRQATDDDWEALEAATRSVIDRPPAAVAVTTALGLRSWIDTAGSLGLDVELMDVLAGTPIVVRGPKARGALSAVGLEVAPDGLVQTAPQLTEVVRRWADPGDRVVAVLDGSADDRWCRPLHDRGVGVVTLAPYRIEATDEALRHQLARQATSGTLDAITFTSASAVEHFVDASEHAGLASALRSAVAQRRLTVACVGPVSAAAARAAGLTEVVEPPRARLGPMLGALTAALASRRREFALAGARVVWVGSAVTIDGDAVHLSQRERAVFEVLAERPGAVVSKSQLAARAWPDVAVDPHAVEAVVGRLRRRLGTAGRGIGTVVRRGYRLEV